MISTLLTKLFPAFLRSQTSQVSVCVCVSVCICTRAHTLAHTRSFLLRGAVKPARKLIKLVIISAFRHSL